MNTLRDPSETQPKRRVDDGLEGAPWPVRAVSVFGALACIAMFSVWFLATTVVKGQDEIKAILAPMPGHVSTSDRFEVTLERLEQDHRDSNRRLERLLEIMCWQQAKSDGQRNSCMERR